MPSVYVKSYGCSANTADAEIIKGILQNNDYQIQAIPDNADANVILTCIVKKPTERKIIKEINRLNDKGKPLVVAGCMPQAMQNKVEKMVPTASLIGPNDIMRVSEAMNEAMQGHRVVYVHGAPTDRTCLPRVRSNNIIHIAPIASGCLGNCSYCIVKKARGQLFNFPATEIVEETRSALEAGCKEVWVTAEDTAAYNDKEIRLPGLLRMLCDVPSDYRIRIGMMTPNQVLPILDDLIEALGHEKVFKFIHLPVQSGNNVILKRMNRRYKVEDFNKIVDNLREAYPHIGISTDIICGFPGESNKQFQDSCDLIKHLRPDVLNISRFWERPGTLASKMNGKLHGRDTKKRSRRLTAIWKELAVDVGQKWIGWEGKVLIDERGKIGTMVGRNYAYKTVVIQKYAIPGSWVKVKVTDTGVGFLKAKII
jgi:MiaB-like tRNA modifying enzyme